MKPYTRLVLAALVAFSAVQASSPVAGQSSSGGTGGALIVYGDVTYFFGPGKPKNCTLNNVYRRGEPVGFRMTAINPATGTRDRNTKLVVHLSYGGRTLDVPMRDRQTEQQPERTFWVAKWMVPDDAPVGVVKYTVTAQDPQGRKGEFKPFDVVASQITIVE